MACGMFRKNLFVCRCKRYIPAGLEKLLAEPVKYLVVEEFTKNSLALPFQELSPPNSFGNGFICIHTDCLPCHLIPRHIWVCDGLKTSIPSSDMVIMSNGFDTFAFRVAILFEQITWRVMFTYSAYLGIISSSCWI